jgi:hypothetical protein
MVRTLLETEGMPKINAPHIVGELAALHDAYERALAANDVPALKAFFWDSPHVVRYGASEHLYGTDAVSRYREGHTPVFTNRQIVRREILTLGPDLASIMCELSQTVAGQERHSRQSQTWHRFPETGWRIVAAHVSQATPPAGASLGWEAYVTEAAAALGLPVHPAHRPGVIQHLQRAASLAGPLLALNLPLDVDPAPIFTP